jgi:uncharacterized membrane protein YfcA
MQIHCIALAQLMYFSYTAKMESWIIFFVIFFSLSVIIMTIIRYYPIRPYLGSTPIPKKNFFILAGTGIVAFFSDVVGVGSFAPQIALLRLTNFISDADIPAIINGVQIIPGAIESVLFLKAIHVDAITLITLIIGACIGGILGGSVVTKLKKRQIQYTMIIAFTLMSIILLMSQLNVLNIDTHATQLRHGKLIIGFFGMILCGSLSAVGVGLFALVEMLLFMLGVRPLIAFPIMTSAGALQQTMTTGAFAFAKKIPLKPTLIIALFGLIGVMIAMPLVKHLSTYWLHWLLLVIVIYNTIMLIRTIRK